MAIKVFIHTTCFSWILSMTFRDFNNFNVFKAITYHLILYICTFYVFVENKKNLYIETGMSFTYIRKCKCKDLLLWNTTSPKLHLIIGHYLVIFKTRNCYVSRSSSEAVLLHKSECVTLMSFLSALGQEPWGKELRKPPLQQQRVLQPASTRRPPPQQWWLSQWQHACSNQPQPHSASQELPAADLQPLHVLQHGHGQQQPAAFA